MTAWVAAPRGGNRGGRGRVRVRYGTTYAGGRRVPRHGARLGRGPRGVVRRRPRPPLALRAEPRLRRPLRGTAARPAGRDGRRPGPVGRVRPPRATPQTVTSSPSRPLITKFGLRRGSAAGA